MRVFAYLMFYEGPDQFVMQTSACIPDADKWERSLIKYHIELGVDEFIADAENMADSVLWGIGERYYTTAQIERIKKLRAFL